jgi:CheY-like chemotaxis protein
LIIQIGFDISTFRAGIPMAKFLRIHNEDQACNAVPWAEGSPDVTTTKCLSEALSLCANDKYDGVYFSGFSDSIIRTIQSNTILDCIPLGVGLLDIQNKVVSVNKRLTSWFPNEPLVGLNFYEAIGHPTIIGPEPSPLSTSVAKKCYCEAVIQVQERYFLLAVTPVLDDAKEVVRLVVSLRDSTETILQRQKLDALHQAGSALADLRPEEIYEMEVEERIELLKDNIIHYTKDLLDFDVIEIRLIDGKTNLLIPLLSVGIDSSVAQQPLYAKSTDNGVTGFVAATGKSYMCEDTTNDPLYLDGLMGAKSSLTVPLKYHDEVIGSFNIESPEVGRFTEHDLQFVECFAHDIGVALNTLKLLNAQQTDTALRSVEAIREAIALPVDEILTDTVQAISDFIGHDQEVTGRLKTILDNARKIKKAIAEVGQVMAIDESIPEGVKSASRPILKDKRILVIDSDKEVRSSAHKLLEKYGCDVETASEGREAILMVENAGDDQAYDAIIADIRLPDIGGYDLLMRLKEFQSDPPLILMTGFGYDPGHSIVKARQAGLKAYAVLFKPFRVEQLLQIVEAMVSGTEVPAK